jgi:hypothetical protein
VTYNLTSVRDDEQVGRILGVVAIDLHVARDANIPVKPIFEHPTTQPMHPRNEVDVTAKGVSGQGQSAQLHVLSRWR